VFKWIEGPDDPLTWNKESVTQKCELNVLSHYSRSQMLYDPFFNEWHYCERFTFAVDGNKSNNEDDYKNYNPFDSGGMTQSDNVTDEAATRNEVLESLPP
jgi:hypothetical protein